VLILWIKDHEGYEDAFVLLGQKTWSYDNLKKHQLDQNAQNIRMVDTVFEELLCYM
jgi:hypothetical protein